MTWFARDARRGSVPSCLQKGKRRNLLLTKQIANARDGLAARKAYEVFVAKRSVLCPPVARSLEEGGLEPLTSYEFPKSMWWALVVRRCRPAAPVTPT